MSFDIEVELQKTFDKAVLRFEAKSLSTPEDWRRHVDIRKIATDRISTATERYFDEYDTRVGTVSQRLINEAAKLNLDHPTPISRDKFDS